MRFKKVNNINKYLKLETDVARNAWKPFLKIINPAYVKYLTVWEKQNYPMVDVRFVGVKVLKNLFKDVIHRTKNMVITRKIMDPRFKTDKKENEDQDQEVKGEIIKEETEGVVQILMIE